MTTRYAIQNGRGAYWKRGYDAEQGNWAQLEQATTWATRVVAEQHLGQRQSYLSLTGRHNDAAALHIVQVQKA